MEHKDIIRGIVITMVVLLILMCIIMATPAGAFCVEPVKTARQAALHEAAELLRSVGYTDDSDEIKALSAAWWKEQENLCIIAKTIQHEANPEYCEWEHSVAVGAVICNRVTSELFPNTVKDVVSAPGQYLASYCYGFENVPRKCYEAAKAALDGNHDVPADAYWQAEFPQGASIWKTFRVDTGYYASTTFICRGVA